MKINSVELESIRSYTQGQIEFPSGTVLLSGDVGHGKSTLLMAVEFALFGLRGSQLSGEDLLREGTNEGSVRLEFTVNKKNYEIERNLKRHGDSVRQESGYLIKNSARQELSPRELKARVFKILGYPMEMLSKRKSLIYRYTVYTPQEKMKEILEASDESRLDTLRKVLGINKYKEIRDNVVTVRRASKHYQNTLQGIYSDLDEKKEDKKQLEEKTSELEKSIAGLKEKKKNRKQELEKHRKRKQDIQEKVQKFHELDKKESNQENDLKNHKNQLKEKENKKKELEQKIQGIKELEKPSDKQLSKIKEETQELQQKKEKYLQENKGITKEIDELLNKKEDIEQKQKELDKQLSNKKAGKKTIEKTTQDLEEAGSECPVCGHELTEEHRRKELEKKRKRIQELEKQIKEHENQEEQAKKDKKELKDKIKQKKDKEIQKVNKKIKERKKLRKKVKEYTEKQEKKKELEQDLEKKQEKIQETRKRIQETRKTLQRTRQELEKVKHVKQKEQEIEKKLEQARKKLSNTKEKLASKKTQLKDTQKNLEDLKKEIRKKKEAKKLNQKIEKHKNWLEGLGELSSTIEEQFMLNLQKRFNNLFNEWFDVLVENDELDVRVNEKFSPIIEREGYQTSYHRLSGGERTSVALAYRLALNEVVNFLVEGINTKDLIILDEPTDGFSTSQLDKVRDIIRDLDISQMILVSHELKVESYVENVINVRKEAGESVIEY